MWLGSKIFRRGQNEADQQVQGERRDPAQLGAVHSHAGASHDVEAERQAERGVHWHRQVPAPQAAPVDGTGRLPLTELTFDRPAAPSPFGEDVEFPLPSHGLNYAHPAVDDDQH